MTSISLSSQPLALRRPPGLPAVLLMLGGDLVSTILYAAFYAATRNLLLAVAVGVAAGAASIGWRVARRQRPDAMQWMSLALVVVFGSAGLLLHDSRLVMVKPTLIYLAVAAVMLKPGWMARYMPDVVKAHGADLVRLSEIVWATAMAGIAFVNLAVAWRGDLAAWGVFVTAGPLVVKAGLSLLQYAALRIVVARRVRASRAQAA